MAINFQFNKTFLHKLNKDLKVRLATLPTLKAKEAALRVEVLKAQNEVNAIEQKIQERRASLGETARLWSEFTLLLEIRGVEIRIKQIAGVKTPVIGTIDYIEAPYSYFASPAWFPMGMDLLKAVTKLNIEKEIAMKKKLILEHARKKTTQKVNLYEKVQIPELQETIRKIKRFLEDEENLAKSSQKILKSKLQREEEEAA